MISIPAIISRTGEVYTNPDLTGDHEDLIDFFGLKDTNNNLCRIYFRSPADRPGQDKTVEDVIK